MLSRFSSWRRRFRFRTRRRYERICSRTTIYWFSPCCGGIGMACRRKKHENIRIISDSGQSGRLFVHFHIQKHSLFPLILRWRLLYSKWNSIKFNQIQFEWLKRVPMPLITSAAKMKWVARPSAVAVDSIDAPTSPTHSNGAVKKWELIADARLNGIEITICEMHTLTRTYRYLNSHLRRRQRCEPMLTPSNE